MHSKADESLETLRLIERLFDLNKLNDSTIWVSVYTPPAVHHTHGYVENSTSDLLDQHSELNFEKAKE